MAIRPIECMRSQLTALSIPPTVQLTAPHGLFKINPKDLGPIDRVTGFDLALLADTQLRYMLNERTQSQIFPNTQDPNIPTGQEDDLQQHTIDAGFDRILSIHTEGLCNMFANLDSPLHKRHRSLMNYTVWTRFIGSLCLFIGAGNCYYGFGYMPPGTDQDVTGIIGFGLLTAGGVMRYILGKRGIKKTRQTAIAAERETLYGVNRFISSYSQALAFSLPCEKIPPYIPYLDQLGCFGQSLQSVEVPALFKKLPELKLISGNPLMTAFKHFFHHDVDQGIQYKIPDELKLLELFDAIAINALAGRLFI